jgi:V/A-type H+-transporting ATPase subunit D
MAKVKLTKGELKKQRDSLKQFQRFLPTLLLKKQQLQSKILEAKKYMEERTAVLSIHEKKIKPWINLLGESDIDIRQWTTPINIEVEMTNVAGASLPIFETVHYDETEYDFIETPFWLDRAIEELQILVSLIVEVDVIKTQVEILEKELRITTQRVNLFEKIKIPECKENIRTITIYLGDQQANAVGISKVAKKKIDMREMEEAEV